MDGFYARDSNKLHTNCRLFMFNGFNSPWNGRKTTGTLNDNGCPEITIQQIHPSFKRGSLDCIPFSELKNGRSKDLPF